MAGSHETILGNKEKNSADKISLRLPYETNSK